MPKGVEITHGNYVANCMQTHFMASLRPDYAAWRARAVALSFLPMYHAYGQTVHAVSLPREHVPVYIMRGRFNLARMLAHVARFRVTALALVPPVAVALTKLRGAEARAAMADLASLEDVGCGAAPLSRETAREFEALVGGRFRLRQGWGMTEITCSACGWDPNVESDAGKVGELNPNVEAMVVDEEGREVAAGERGELLVRGPNVMKGYWRRPEATREALTEHGWLKTGDIAVAHPDGCLSIVDRKKVGIPGGTKKVASSRLMSCLQELIKVKGNQVAPAELEGVLLDHPSIQDAAVVGVTMSARRHPLGPPNDADIRHMQIRPRAPASVRGAATRPRRPTPRHCRLDCPARGAFQAAHGRRCHRRCCSQESFGEDSASGVEGQGKGRGGRCAESAVMVLWGCSMLFLEQPGCSCGASVRHLGQTIGAATEFCIRGISRCFVDYSPTKGRVLLSVPFVLILWARFCLAQGIGVIFCSFRRLPGRGTGSTSVILHWYVRSLSSNPPCLSSELQSDRYFVPVVLSVLGELDIPPRLVSRQALLPAKLCLSYVYCASTAWRMRLFEVPP